MESLTRCETFGHVTVTLASQGSFLPRSQLCCKGAACGHIHWENAWTWPVCPKKKKMDTLTFLSPERYSSSLSSNKPYSREV